MSQVANFGKYFASLKKVFYEVVAKAAAEDVWTRGKRALLAFAHREPVEAPKEQPDDDDDNTGFLERIRGAGKRLVG